MMARNSIIHSPKHVFVAIAVLLLLFACGGTAYAAKADGDVTPTGGLTAAPGVTTQAVEAPGGQVTDGDSFVAALGDQATYVMNDGVCVVTLNGDVKLCDVALLNAGSYKLTGDGAISRAEGHRGLLFKVVEGVSLEISGSVILDGGAVWAKDGESVDSAVGASNSGVVATASLVDNIRGSVVVSENAVLRNNDSFAAVYAERGTTIMSGGSIYANKATSNYGGGIHAIYGSVEMSGGEIRGNVAGPSALASAIYGYASASVTISHGSVHDNGGPVAVSATPLTVSGGTFSNNLGAALGRSDDARISGGTFSGNAGGAFANTLTNKTQLQLSGAPVFVTDEDKVITAMVKLVGDLGDDVTVRLAVNEYRMGNQVLFGDQALLDAYHSRFRMTGDDEGLVVNAAGRIDTDPSSFVHNGDDLVRLFGGEEVATSSYDGVTGIYTITLKGDVALPRMTYIESGSYVLTGTGTITRSGNYPGALLKTITGTSLEITGSVVLDGGAAWTKDGEPAESAVGARNTGVVSNMALVDNYGGSLRISGNVILRNNSNNCAVYCDNGALEITGGQIYGISSTDGGGAVRTVSSSSVTILGGEFWGNAVTSGARGSVIAAENSAVTIEGGTFRDNSGPAAVVARNLTVNGGAFANNAGAALGTYGSNPVKLTGGTFEDNAGGAFACTGGTAILQLSGSPAFQGETDTVRAAVQLTGPLGEGVSVKIQSDSFTLGDTVLSGSDELLAAYASQFTVVSESGEYVITPDGRIDTSTTSLITSGDAFAAALGGMGFATSEQDEETGVYTITLMNDVALSHRLLIEQGSYVLTSMGAHVLSRADGYKDVLLKNETGASLEIAGSVVIDGGAVWEGAEVESSAVGASNSGATSNMALVDNYGGALKISGDATLRNNDGNCAVYCDNGMLDITGGQIYGIRSKDGGGAVRTVSGSTVAISGGEFWGNVVTSNGRGSAVDGENSTVVITGGTFRDSSGPAVVAARNLTVEGGVFANNQGAALGTRSSNSVALSSGTFDGNAGGAFACTYGNTSLQLSGSPAFVGETDTVRAAVQLMGPLGDSVMVRMRLDSYTPGQKVLTGDEVLIAAYHGRFSLVGADGQYIVNASGEIDVNPAQSINDGDSFVAALGGDGVATSEYDEQADVYTVTLADDVALSRAIEVTSGSYVLAGEGIISRASGYTAALFRIVEGASLEISDRVSLDGGAVWMKDDQQVDSAVGATNEGAKSVMALVNSYGGDFELSGNAVLRNNDGNPALYGSGGAIIVSGGSIYGNRRSGYGAAVDFSNATLEITGGVISGNMGAGVGAIVRGSASDSTVTISGGSVSDNAGPVAVAGANVAVSDGEFVGNSGAVLGVHEAGTAAVSGGTFNGNPGGVFTADGGPVSLQLSGAPTFTTPDDATVHATVQLVGELADGVSARIQLESYKVGDQVLFGDGALIKAYYQRFTLVGENNVFVVDSFGRVDTNPTSFVTSGDALAAALGGAAVTSSSYNKATRTYTVTLKGDVALTHAIVIESGSYVLAGSGTISRGGAYTDALLKVAAGTSLKIAGNVVLDGGALYVKDGERVDSPNEGDDNAGIWASAPLVFSDGGNVVVSGDAALCNNCGYAAIWAERGSVSMDGGSIYGIVTDELDGGAAIFANEGSVRVSSGAIRDNLGEAAVIARDLAISGGAFLNNDAFAALCYDDAGSVAISGGTFSGNNGAVAAFGSEDPIPIQLSGAPVFEGAYDVIIGEIEVTGKLTGSDIPVYPIWGDVGLVAVRGSGSYALTEADVAKFALPEFDAPPEYYLDFDAENNQIVLARAETAVLLEVTAADDIEFDGAAIESGVDFDVKAFKYVDGVKGDDITTNYASGGGAVPLTYRYRSADSASYTMGLPSTPGTYEVQVVAAADKANDYASCSARFTLSIVGGLAVTFHDGQGNVITTQWVVPGGTAKAPAEPTRKGYVFKGWDVDFSHVTSNLDVTALWEKAAVAKLGNPMAVKAKKALKVKASKLRKKTQKIAAAKAIAVNGAVGKVTYKLTKVTAKKKLLKQAKKKIKVAANGKITLKKKLKKGTYKLTVVVSASGNTNYKPVAKTTTVKVRVR